MFELLNIAKNEVEKEFFSQKKFLVTYYGIYEVFYSVAQRCYYCHKIYDYLCFNNGARVINKKGYYHFVGATSVNGLVGYTLMNE